MVLVEIVSGLIDFIIHVSKFCENILY